MKYNQKMAITTVVLFQLLIIIGLFIRAWHPLWLGEEVRVKTVPVDPRSLFRGNYARMSYEFTRVPAAAFSGDTPKKGDTVYTLLKRGPDGFFQIDSASKTKPKAGIFIRGRVKSGYLMFNVDYGIDAFFAPKKEALKMEADLRDGGIAVLKVSANGRAAIDKIIPNPKQPRRN